MKRIKWLIPIPSELIVVSYRIKTVWFMEMHVSFLNFHAYVSLHLSPLFVHAGCGCHCCIIPCHAGCEVWCDKCRGYPQWVSVYIYYTVYDMHIRAHVLHNTILHVHTYMYMHAHAHMIYAYTAIVMWR